MKPPYEITPEILRLVAAVSQKTGIAETRFLLKTNPMLRKQNRIKIIHSSLHIEGNTLSEEQVTALLENKRVAGPLRDITEVQNAIRVYDKLADFDFRKEKDFLKAHGLLMEGLLEKPGRYRTKGVGIAKGAEIIHLPPPHGNVPFLIKNLFAYLKEKTELPLIRSCVFHYELAFIHPFMDGNGRMARLWQTCILMSAYPVMEYLPFETLISQEQPAYYAALAEADKQGSATPFVSYLLGVIDAALSTLLQSHSAKPQTADRLMLFLEQANGAFTRKDYVQFFKNISAPTASRDLKQGIEEGLIERTGDKKTSIYQKRGAALK